MAQVAEISDVVKECLVPEEISSSGAKRGKVDMIPVLDGEGITLEEAIKMLNSQKDSTVFWSNSSYRGGFMFRCSNNVRQTDGTYVRFPTTRYATSGEVIHAMHSVQNSKLDRRLTWLDEVCDFFRQIYTEFKPLIYIFGTLGALLAGAWLMKDSTPRMLNATPQSYKCAAALTAEAMLVKDHDFAETYVGDTPDMIARASAETGVNEDVFRAMAAFGMSEDSKILRERGYKGLIPVDPFAVGARPELLENDDYFSMTAFAEMYKKIRQDVCDDETAVGIYITSEDAVAGAKENASNAHHTLEGWDNWDNMHRDQLKRIERLIALVECARSGEEPDECLFKPMNYSRGDAIYDWGEADLRKLYKEFKDTAAEHPGQSLRHYKHLKRERERISRTPEDKAERRNLVSESVWFANLPGYASSVIARVYGGMSWD